MFTACTITESRSQGAIHKTGFTKFGLLPPIIDIPKDINTKGHNFLNNAYVPLSLYRG